MPEYRRFIAYFYEYIDGKKTNNAGFAKVELRSGMWRILFRLSAGHSPEPPVQVYGFVRKQEYLLGLMMGTMRPGCQMMEEWAYDAGNPIWEKEYFFEDLAGIWIQCGDGRKYVTVWDDDPIDVHRFVLELPKEEPGRLEAAAAYEYVGADPDSERSVSDAESEAQQLKIEAAQIGTDGIYTELERRSRERGQMEGGDENGSFSARAAGGEIGYSGEAVRERGQMEGGDENGSFSARAAEGEIGYSGEAVRESGQMEGGDANGNFSAQTAGDKMACQRVIRTILEQREVLEPFEDDQFRKCVKILPCDLVELQQVGWQVGRSSFLLHGFYQYHHLMLGELSDGSMVLAVPGLQNPQERYMAMTFGFPDFKTAKWKEKGRQFGYWYRKINAVCSQETESAASSPIA